MLNVKSDSKCLGRHSIFFNARQKKKSFIMVQIDLTNYEFDLYVLKKLVTSLLNPTLLDSDIKRLIYKK